MSDIFDSLAVWLNKSTSEKPIRLVLLLDYDGTLVPICNNPKDARLPGHTRKLLADFSAIPGIRLCILSGRDQEFLLSQLGSINLDIGTEHGAELKLSDQKKTIPLVKPITNEMLKTVEMVFNEYCNIIDGSALEIKSHSGAWHYRNAPTVTNFQVLRMVDTLAGILKESNYTVLLGSKVVEVRPANVNKGVFLDAYLKILGPTFENSSLLAFGDDTTDEDLFEAISLKNGCSVKIGIGETAAQLIISDQSEVEPILKKLYNYLQFSLTDKSRYKRNG